MDNGKYLIDIGKKIRTARKSKKLSIKKLAALCKIDHSGLWRIEVGRKNVRILTLQTIAKALKMNIKDFL